MRPDPTSAAERTPAAPPPGAMPTALEGPVELTLPTAIDAPAAARLALSAWMAGHISDTLLADTQLVVAELVANSVRHADAPADAVITVRAEVRGDVLRLEVADRGNGRSIARRAPDLHHGGGFGLHLVEVLSRRWGVHRAAGTRVWVELDFARTR
jgi:anti-sigma regulatory factor (Ser/Thr protein kinase)